MTDIYPPDYSNPVGLVRGLIPDVDQPDWEGDGKRSYLFTDLHLKGLLSLYGDGSSSWQIKRAAADAVAALAISEALISKVIKTEDLQADGAKLANALLARAQQLRLEANDEQEDEDALTSFTIVNFVPERPVPIQDWTLPIATWRSLLTP